jgi:hypothetical protein
MKEYYQLYRNFGGSRDPKKPRVTLAGLNEEHCRKVELAAEKTAAGMLFLIMRASIVSVSVSMTFMLLVIAAVLIIAAAVPAVFSGSGTAAEQAVYQFFEQHDHSFRCWFVYSYE